VGVGGGLRKAKQERGRAAYPLAAACARAALRQVQVAREARPLLRRGLFSSGPSGEPWEGNGLDCNGRPVSSALAAQRRAKILPRKEWGTVGRTDFSFLIKKYII